LPEIVREVLGHGDLATGDQVLSEGVDVGAADRGLVAGLPRDGLERGHHRRAAHRAQLLDVLGVVSDVLGHRLG
jgi:hypothetical protein